MKSNELTLKINLWLYYACFGSTLFLLHLVATYVTDLQIDASSVFLILLQSLLLPLLAIWLFRVMHLKPLFCLVTERIDSIYISLQHSSYQSSFQNNSLKALRNFFAGYAEKLSIALSFFNKKEILCYISLVYLNIFLALPFSFLFTPQFFHFFAAHPVRIILLFIGSFVLVLCLFVIGNLIPFLFLLLFFSKESLEKRFNPKLSKEKNEQE